MTDLSTSSKENKQTPYLNIEKKIDDEELKCFGKKISGNLQDRCSNLELFKKIFVFGKINKDLTEGDESLFTAINLRVYYIQNNIDVTPQMNRQIFE